MSIFKRKRQRGPSEGEVARRQAERDLAATKAQTPEFRALGESLRRRREANHLTELFLAIHREGR